MIDAESARTDKNIREQFIRGNEEFILASAGKVCHRRITRSDDEWSVALSAFNEAIDSYDRCRGSFEGFAYTVISRRLTDELRRQYRRSSEIAVEPYVFDGSLDDEPTAIQLETARQTAQMSASDPSSAVCGTAADEIAQMQEVLRRYGFSFYDLAECSPKAGRTRRGCAQAIGALIHHQELLQGMRSSGTLPATAIRSIVKISPKLLERHRRYIIAAAEILDGDYPILQSYLQTIRKEMQS